MGVLIVQWNPLIRFVPCFSYWRSQCFASFRTPFVDIYSKLCWQLGQFSPGTIAWELRKFPSTIMQPLFSHDQNMRAETLMQTLACQLSSTLMLRPRRERCESSHANWRLSTPIINSQATLVLVRPGHESWENSHSVAEAEYWILLN